MTTQEVLEKHFKENKTIYFQSSDRLRQIEGDTYLRYQKNDGIELWIGGDNGEFCLTVTRDGDKLDRLIREIIY